MRLIKYLLWSALSSWWSGSDLLSSVGFKQYEEALLCAGHSRSSECSYLCAQFWHRCSPAGKGLRKERDGVTLAASCELSFFLPKWTSFPGRCHLSVPIDHSRSTWTFLLTIHRGLSMSSLLLFISCLRWLLSFFLPDESIGTHTHTHTAP